LRIGAPHASGNAGFTTEIVGPYLIKIASAGAPAAPGVANTVDPESVRGIVLRLGYKLAATGN
jgi:hypothetical protein